MAYRRRDYSGSGILNDIVVLLLSVIVIGIFFVNLAIYYIQKNPIEALEVIIGFMLVIWFVVVGIKKILKYLGQGAGSWILEVIREIKGISPITKATKSERIKEQKIYEANQQDVDDAVATLIKFGWTKQNASSAVLKAVISNPLAEVNDVSKIVKKVFSEK